MSKRAPGPFASAIILGSLLFGVPFGGIITLYCLSIASLPTLMFVSLVLLLFGSIFIFPEKRGSEVHGLSDGIIYFVVGVSASLAVIAIAICRIIQLGWGFHWT